MESVATGGSLRAIEPENGAWQRRRRHGKTLPMPKRSRPPAHATDPAAARRDVVFAALADPLRRRLLEQLADGKPRTATACAGHLAKRLQATIKHLVQLRDAALVEMSPDPADSRRQLYTLSPQVQVRRSDAGAVEMDFGCCVLRMEGPLAVVAL
jgi:DNA-binding transcriptional ArsR family regulator